ncbi:hypothetical protein ACGFNU_13720 [Spirillospora sp. NPDC048911]|uniref:hypothetical protein n=1 Tax=Spirillospora sp. NPDC048911 TaxID=3364527 RepID=UPI00371D23FE
MRYDDIHRALVAGTAAEVLPAWAHRLLDDVAAGRLAVAAVRHPLGFLCLPVERSGDLGVCLHIWSPEVPAAPATTSPVHCHSWDLISFVLYGTVRNARADVTEPPEPTAPQHTVPGHTTSEHTTLEQRTDQHGTAQQRIFQVVSRDGIDELQATPRTVSCTPGDSSIHRTGDTYTLPAGVFHSTFVEGGPDAATVALGRRTPGGGDLSLGPLDVPTHRTHREPCAPDEATRAARRAARLLARAHTGTAHPDTAPDDVHPSARL